jgi:hypothetical protein
VRAIPGMHPVHVTRHQGLNIIHNPSRQSVKIIQTKGLVEVVFPAPPPVSPFGPRPRARC